MKSVRITDRGVAERVAALLDEDVFAVQEVEDMEREQAEVDRLLESVGLELVTEGRRAAFRMARESGDGAWVRRSRRRAERASVRALPTSLSARALADADEFELGEAA